MKKVDRIDPETMLKPVLPWTLAMNVILPAILALYNMTAVIGHSVGASWFTRWLDVTKPVVDVVAANIAAFESLVVSMTTHGYVEHVPVVTNVLAFDLLATAIGLSLMLAFFAIEYGRNWGLVSNFLRKLNTLPGLPRVILAIGMAIYLITIPMAFVWGITEPWHYETDRDLLMLALFFTCYQWVLIIFLLFTALPAILGRPVARPTHAP